MTEKELLGLKRREILDILCLQMKEDARLRERILDLESDLASQEAQNRRLKKRLDEKDEHIEHLKGKLDKKDRLLDQKDAEIERLSSEGIESFSSEEVLRAALKIVAPIVKAAQEIKKGGIRRGETEQAGS